MSDRTWIVCWHDIGTGKDEWMPCYTREDANRIYACKVEQDMWTVTLCEALRSTDYFVPEGSTQ